MSIPNNNNVREFKTNIQPLDKLLGYDETLGSGTGIKPGDIIVLRGGPGSGKTTLGLQIMSRYLESDDHRGAGNKPAAVFLSLELDPEKAIEKAERDYGFFKEGQRRNLKLISPNDMNRLIDKLGRKFSIVPPLSYIGRGFLKALIKIATYLGFGALMRRLVEEIAKELLEPIANRLYNFVRSLVRKRRIKPPKDNSVGGVIFIDSINALLTMVHQSCQGQKWEPRLVLKRACESMRSTFGNFVILASSEFHHEASYIPTGISESFLSDVEISLSNEPIAVPVEYETSRQGSAGYNIFKIIEKVEGEEGTKLESRSFVRILKNRKGANQSRRCAYDIVSGVGIQFYETYPGDGHILLFSENPKQKQVWDTFFKEDLPQLYPALRYEDFDRSSLQRTFLNQRRSRYVPSRTDMYVSSFDNYWIHWYGELCWRRAIEEVVKESVQVTEKNKKQVSMLISAIHKSLMKYPKDLHKSLLEQLKLDKESWIPNEVLTAFASLSRRKNCVKCFLCRACWWLLKGIPKDKKRQEDFNEACALWVKAKTDPVKKQDETKDSILIKTKIVPEITEIVDVLHKMFACVTECCPISPVRMFSDDLINNCGKSNGIDVLKQQEKSAYSAPQVDNVFIEKQADKIQILLENNQIDLSEIIKELQLWIRPDYLQNMFEKELWRCAKQTPKEKLKPKIMKLLSKYLKHKENVGCECVVEFRNYLKNSSIRKKEVILHKLNELKQGREREPQRNELKQEITNLSKIYKSLLSLRNQGYEILNKFFDVLPLMIGRSPDEMLEGSTTIENIWKKYTNTENKQYFAQYSLIMAYYKILKKRNMFHFLSSTPNEKIRLFGERRSQIIEELENFSPDNKRPIHRPGLLFSLRDTRSFIAVPYNANISFIVFRNDLLKEFIKKRIWSGKDKENYLKEYATRVLELYEDQLNEIGKTLEQEYHLTEVQKNDICQFIKDNIKKYIEHSEKDKRSPKAPVQTWEELIVLLELMSDSDGDKKKRHFVIETQTLDTLLCTILELLWNCGGNLTIRPDYSIKEEKHTKEKLFQALYLLCTMLQKGIIPEDSTLDVTHFANKYTKPPESEYSNNSADWVFARHWYSTLVELLSTKKEKLTYKDGSAVREISSSEFSWQNSKTKLGIMPIPISLSYYLEYKEKAPHISCWGDWHWIMTEGTENIELGTELINNLVSSQKICERAFQCAAVPTVEAFYTLHGNSNCLNLPERRYDTPDMLPDVTFKQLREMCFKDARSRSQIFDYEHCMLELQSLIRFVQTHVKTDNPDWAKLKKEIEDAFDRIKALRTKSILIA